MNDNERYAILFPLISGDLAAMGITNVDVLQSMQPTQQGVPSGRAVYLSKLYEKTVGHLRRDSVYDSVEGVMRDVELQRMEATYQVNALSRQDPSDVNSLTASDIVKAVWYIMQRSETIARLRGNGLAILRVNELRNPNFVNESDRFEFSPSFDFTLIYEQEYRAEVPAIETVEHNIKRV